MIMKKLFLFCAAMLVAFAANATTWQISPTTNPESPRQDCNLYVTLDRVAAAGDTIVLADGIYDEPYSATIKHNVVIVSAEGAHPVIENKGYFDVKANAKVIGIKFKFVGEAGNGYGFYIRENTAKYLWLENCEFQDFTKYCITGSSSSAHCDSCIVNNCYFHDNLLSPIYFPASSLAENVNLCDYVKVTNCTFANTTTLNGAGIIDNRNNGSNSLSTSRLVVDHCTFYNCSGYERLIHAYKSPLFYVSNCIFANPTMPASGTYSTYAYGGEVKNNLSYNTSGHRDWDSHPTLIGNITGNPLFADAANGDYHLAWNSPALGTDSLGGNMGDSRWWPAIPSTATTVYLNPGLWNADGAKYAIYAYEPGKTPEYVWSDFLTLAAGETDIYTGTVPAGYSHLIFARLADNCVTPNWNQAWNQTGNLTIVEGTTKNLFTMVNWNQGNWSTYVAPIEDGYYLIGDLNGVAGTWTIADLYVNRKLSVNPSNNAEYMIEDVTLAEGDSLKIVHVANRAIDGWFPDQMDNYDVDAFHTGLTDIYFRPTPINDASWYGGQIYVSFTDYHRTVANWATMCVPYNAVLHNATAYDVTSCLVDHIVVEPIDGILEAGKAYIIKPDAPNADVVVVASGAKTQEPDDSGILKGNLGAEKAVAADANNYVLSGGMLHSVVSSGNVDDIVTVKQYRAYLHIGMTAAPSLRIIEAENGATNIQNVEGNEAAVKFIKNGQLYIQKDGVVYTAAGVAVK